MNILMFRDEMHISKKLINDARMAKNVRNFATIIYACVKNSHTSKSQRYDGVEVATVIKLW